MGIEKPSALMRLIGGLGAVAEIGFGDVIAVNITSEEPKKKTNRCRMSGNVVIG